MAEKIGVAALIAAITASNNWQEVMQIKDALDKRLIDVPVPKMTAAEIKQRFSGVKKVKLVGLRDHFLNGMEVEVVELAQTKIVVSISKYGVPQRTRIPAICAIPVDEQ